MKKGVFAALIALGISSLLTPVWAVPAYPGWRTIDQPDGTTIELRQVGDEFYHYWINREGQPMVKNESGYWEVKTTIAPSEQAQLRRQAADAARKMRAASIRKNGGNTSMTKGVVILVNYKDVSFKSANNKAAFTAMMTDDSYSYKPAYPGSAHKYFYDQSNGQYDPQFDVYGPYTLSNNRSYYGANDREGNDKNPAQMIKDACTLADADVDFSQYDLDKDGEVDFVYVFYAGNGEADSDVEDAVWPHSWTFDEARISQTCDGKQINLYACSSELDGDNVRTGIATFCHEFSHVIGMPDYYDVYYGTNYDNEMTPGDWSLMDNGSYNGDGYCPPNYSAYDKYYMGWSTPTILNSARNVTMTTGYSDAYQLNASGSLAAYNNTGTQYYLENRQQSGWDKALPGHGMLVWKVTFKQSAWDNNGPNATAGTIRYGLLSATGSTTNIGSGKDPYPGTSKVTSISSSAPFITYSITEITESSQKIYFKFMGGDVNCHDIEVKATNCTVSPSVPCVENGNGFTATITPQNDTYDITSVAVKRGSNTLTAGTHYTLSSDKQTLTVNASAVTGSVSDAFTITATATKNRCTYGILSDPDVCMVSSDEGTININEALNLTITASGYYLGSADCWEVEMGDNTLIYGTDFTYDTSTGAFSIAKVTGDVGIYIYPHYTITWSVDGVTTPTYFASGATLVLPTTPSDCSNGKMFVGWTEDGSFEDGDTDPQDLFIVVDSKTVSSHTTYYAVYATETDNAPIRKAGMTDSVYTFSDANWTSVPANRWTKDTAGVGYLNNGVQFTSSNSSGQATSKTSFTNISKIVVNYCTNAKKGAGTIDIMVGKNKTTSKSVTSTGGTTARNLEFSYDTPVNGTVTIGATCTTNSIYIGGITISSGSSKTYTDYALTCTDSGGIDPATDIEAIVEKTCATKRIENGMLIIEYNGIRYTIMGEVVR